MIRAANGYEPEDFNSWFAHLPENEGVMSLIYQMYQLDQVGKANKETIIINLKARKIMPPATIEQSIEKLNEALKYGVLEDVFRLARNKKKNQ